jgi:PadR family transcriptional regulator PadR
MRKTHALVSVLIAFTDDPVDRHWGYDLAKRTGLRSGVLYPILHRLLEEGWLEDGWEDRASLDGRPPRRYYRLTGEGASAAREVLSEARVDARFARLLGTIG